MNKKAIHLIYIHTFLSTFILFYSCDTLYYLERGISSSEYMIFVIVAYFVKVVFELPSGMLADKFDKRNILFIGNLLFFISTLIFIYSHNYILFIIATMLNAINVSITTGISNSLIYEYNNKKEEFNKLIFKNSFFYSTSYMIAMILGGAIGQHFGLVNTYYITLIPTFLNFFIIFLIKEPLKNDNKTDKPNKFIFRNAIYEIKKSGLIINMILTSSIIFSIIKIIEESHPDYSNSIGIDAFGIGIYTSLILIFCILGNYIGSKLKPKNQMKLLKIAPLLCGVCILLLGLLNCPLGIIYLLLLFYIFSESFDNIMISIVHSNISSKSRVTVESIISFTICILGLIFSIASSLLLNIMKVYQLYIVLGIILIIYSLTNFILVRKINIIHSK